MTRTFLLIALCSSLFGAAIGYDCREYDCVSSFTRNPAAAPNPPVPANALTNEQGHAIWIAADHLHFWNGSVETVGSSSVAPDFSPFDLSNTDLIAWREGPGSFFLRDALALDTFSSRLGMVFTSAGYFDLNFADPVHINAAGNAILFRGVIRRDLFDNPIERNLLVAVAWDEADLARLAGNRASAFAPARIPEPSTFGLLLAGFLVAGARVCRRRRTTIGEDARVPSCRLPLARRLDVRPNA